MRTWEEAWGMERNTEEAAEKVRDDDTLMWRGQMLYVVLESRRRSGRR